MSKKGMPRFVPQLLLLSAAIIWGGAFVVMKNSVDVFPPCYLLAMRFTIAAVVMAVVFFKRMRKISKRALLWGVISGVCLITAYYVQTIGLMYTTPGKNAFLTAIYCVLVPFFAFFAGGDKPSIWNVAAAFICLVGIGLVSVNESLSINKGDLLTMLCGVFYAVHLLVLNHAGKHYDPMSVSTVQFATAGAVMWVVGGLTETFPAASAFTSDSITGLLFLAVCASAMALSFQALGQKYSSPCAASILLSLEAVFGVVFSMLFYGEELTLKIAMGFALIFAAVITSETQWGFLRRRENAIQTHTKTIHTKER